MNMTKKKQKRIKPYYEETFPDEDFGYRRDPWAELTDEDNTTEMADGYIIEEIKKTHEPELHPAKNRKKRAHA